MKRKITLLLFAAGSALSMNSQVVLTEDFNSPFTLNSATGWTVQNNSSPTSTLSWFQGNGSVFSAFSGGSNDYYAANFNSTAGTGTISNWLISPAVTVYNGAVIEFATRTINSGTVIPDGMQLRLSTTNTNALPTGVASVGSFSILLLDINPNLSTSSSSVVTSGVVNGYPQSWAVYTVAVTGVTGTVTGRFAFRYNVANGGPTGANSNYIGVDAVKYTLPCGPVATSYTTCANTPVTLNATGGLATTTYSWSTGATTQSISVSPASTTIYTLYPYNGTVACGNSTTATVTIGSQLSMNVSASSNTVCAGGTVTLTATSAASSYSWNTGATTAVITVTPNSTTTYSVGGASGLCFGGNTISISALPSPTLSALVSPSISCPSGTITVTASGASSYIWVLGSQATTVNPVSVNTSTNPAGGTFTLGLIGTGANGCSAAGVLINTISPTPTITAVVSNSVPCVNKTVTLTASGASTYAWSGATTSTANPVTYSTGTTAGVKSLVVVGTSSAGCTASTSISFSVSACVGIEKINGNSLEASVFPNPFTNQLTLSGLVGRVEIYNALGQLVINTVTGENETINTTELVKGAYILKAYTNDNSVRTIKLLKN